MATPIRDIRRDIGDRLATIQAERERLQANLQALEEEETAYRRILELENQYFPLDVQQHPESPSDFIVRVLQGGPRSKEEIRDLVAQAGYFKDSPNFGRSLHATFINLQKASRVETGPDGKLRVPVSLPPPAEASMAA
jgi:hypothetical protein